MNKLTDEEKIEQIKSRLPAKLKVIAEAWNPVLQLLALAFDNGKIMAKAIDRKTCWKRSLAEDDGIIKNIWKTPSGGTFEIRSMAFSPDGEILAVSMNNGFIQFLTASSGKIGYTVDGREAYDKLVWENVHPQSTNEMKDPSLSFATASSFDFNDEGPKECAQQIADMEDYFHRHFYSFYGTVLFGVTENALLHLYIGGIMYCHSLNVLHHHEFGSFSDTSSLQVLDCMVNDETKNVEVLYQITEMENNEIVNNTFVCKYDLGWNRETFGTLSVIAASFFKINFLLIYLREMVRYTAHGLEESTENLYQKVIRMFYGNYKMTMNAPWSFFHEMIQHLSGNTVSLAYFDSLRKARSGTPAGQLHFSKIINEYNEKRLGALDTGCQRIALAVETIVGLYRFIIDSYSPDFLFVQSHHFDDEPSKIDKNAGISQLTSYYCDLVIFQKLIDNIRTVIDKKRLGFQYLSYYLTQFIGEALVRSDVRIPTSILHNVLAKVPSLENPPKTLQAFRDISNMTEPFGYYPLPRIVAACNHNCPHNSKYLNGEQEQIVYQANPNYREIFQDNSRKTNPFVSVYLWRTERYFDFVR
uniref:Anaphase-promoting complex subunit 4-like WD40 domain-containing protein n=1 Tax=Panagrolaimus sp. PS1159 TaxID=55785 RepID=A0AC35FNQ6_9BILA